VRYIPASPLPENVISADAMPAVATIAVVAIRRFFMSFPRVEKIRPEPENLE
jgi:hypothetical protein